jgi:uncharacterized protein YacL (UPF0231 family)
MNPEQVKEALQDEVNLIQAKLREIETQNKALKESRATSVNTIKKAQLKIDAEAVAIRYYDQKVEDNMRKYYELSDKLKPLVAKNNS